MGSPDAFRGRQRELEQRGENFDDVAVVESYRRECAPTGEMGRYLQSCDIVVRLGPVMFVHAALPKPPEVDNDNVGVNALPFLDGSGDTVTRSVEEWTNAVNTFGKTQVNEWASNMERFDYNGGQWSSVGGFNHGDFGGDLIQYGMGWNQKREKIPTVCYASWLVGGNPSVFEGEATAKFLQEFFSNSTSPLNVIGTGHQPHGDTPLPMKFTEERDDQFVITCDTSYSGDVVYVGGDGEITNKGRSEKNWNGRGDYAVSEVLFEIDDDDSSLLGTRVRGVLADGVSEYDFDVTSDGVIGRNATARDFGESQIYVKQALEGDIDNEIEDDATWFVKGKLDDERYLASYAKGWTVWNTILRKKS